jgi:hypothetical protein
MDMWMIMSDSHDRIDKLESAVKYANKNRIDVLFHCGDIISPFSAKILKNFNGNLYVVFGNNDGEITGLRKILGQNVSRKPKKINIGNKKILLMHEPPVDFENLEYHYVFYGHLHKIDIRQDKKMIINPGEICGYLTGKSTFVLLNEKTNENRIIEI